MSDVSENRNDLDGEWRKSMDHRAYMNLVMFGISWLCVILIAPFAVQIVLNTRTLSPTQSLNLATGLLDKRVSRGHFSNDADDWFVARITAGTLPADLVDRYYLEYLELRIDAPSSAIVGRRISIGFESSYRQGNAFVNPGPSTIFGEIMTEDSWRAWYCRCSDLRA